ncbi:leucine-rich repeat transmembrane neuronal 4-like protein [Labeo rohita]|uniref:Leucine-rich repeat transmembrane neuronal 4-like protein n=1 Tax=Labeo rohita TaxID=84645 RepID=A0A498NY43_LABRO|nr:leucine-rich repeat transmembrane neuronal 4-like protein [Labeo rohita]
MKAVYSDYGCPSPDEHSDLLQVRAAHSGLLPGPSTLRLNMSYEGPPQTLEGLEELPPRERSTIQTVALPAVPTINTGTVRPCSPPSQRAPVEGPSIPYPTTERSINYPTTERSTSTLTFRR